jgi:hypothetical protein
MTIDWMVNNKYQAYSQFQFFLDKLHIGGFVCLEIAQKKNCKR